MKLNMFLIFFLLLCLPSVVLSQEQGIKFQVGVTWKQLKEIARQENKFIFVDCFTTWCGPCKLMEKEVYPDEEVGNYFNAHFISVKSQMDKTDKDIEQVKNWYKDAEALQREYGVPAYPTYLFFAPDGKLVNRDLGYKGANDFLAMAKKALTYEVISPYQGYYFLMQKYQQGNKDYSVLPFLVDTANLLGQNELAKQMAGDYMKYLAAANGEILYTKTNISFLASFVKGSGSNFFNLFYLNGVKIDSVMDHRGFAQEVVDRVIQQEDIIPFAHLNTGMHWSGPAEVRPEPNWQQLVAKVVTKYPHINAERLVILARVQWYSDQQDWVKCAKLFAVLMNGNSFDNNNDQQDLFFNSICWGAIFQHSDDKTEINAAIGCMEGVIERVDRRGDAPFCFLDTYANLLFKVGRKKEAIQEEEKALNATIEWKEPEGYIQEYRTTLENMKEKYVSNSN